MCPTVCCCCLFVWIIVCVRVVVSMVYCKMWTSDFKVNVFFQNIKCKWHGYQCGNQIHDTEKKRTMSWWRQNKTLISASDVAGSIVDVCVRVCTVLCGLCFLSKLVFKSDNLFSYYWHRHFLQLSDRSLQQADSWYHFFQIRLVESNCSYWLKPERHFLQVIDVCDKPNPDIFVSDEIG